MNNPSTVLHLLCYVWAATIGWCIAAYLHDTFKSWRAWRATPKADASFNHHATQAIACVTPDRIPLRVVGGTDQ